MTLAAQVRGFDASDVQGAIVMTRDGEHIVVAAALDGLSAGEHELTLHTNGDCASSFGAQMASLVRISFKTTPHGQGMFSERLPLTTPLSALRTQAALISRASQNDAPAVDGSVPVACGVLAAIAR